MSVKHTPGPLIASKGHDGEEDRWIVTADGPTPFIVAVIENGQPGDTLETEEATARLFSAAPEMLALLLTIHSNFPLRGMVTYDGKMRTVRAFVDDAIAKALGTEKENE